MPDTSQSNQHDVFIISKGKLNKLQPSLTTSNHRQFSGLYLRSFKMITFFQPHLNLIISGDSLARSFLKLPSDALLHQPVQRIKGWDPNIPAILQKHLLKVEISDSPLAVFGVTR